MTPTGEVVRAVTREGTFRVVAVDASDAAATIVEAQHATGNAARLLGELVVGSVLFRETMSPDLRVQVILKPTQGKTYALGDTIGGGSVRGLLRIEPNASFELGPDACIQVMRTLHDGRIAQGIVHAPADGGVAGALMAYMQQSEQVDSMVAIGVRFDAGTLVRAAGYMVQLLPEVGKGPLAIMTERLEDFRDLAPLLARKEFDASWLVSELLYGMPYEPTGVSPVQAACWCDRVRVIGAIATLPPADIRELSESPEALDISCDYCGRNYSIAGQELRGLLRPS
jgi:molecular chaperone Hsp33